MIVPTPRAAMVALVAAPVGLALGAFWPGGWALCLLWVLGVAMLVLVDGAMAARIAAPTTATAPGTVPVGGQVRLAMPSHDDQRITYAAEATSPLQPDGPLSWRAHRRGLARIGRLWMRATGPLGMGGWQVSRRVDLAVRITPDTGPTHEQAMAQHLQSTRFGNRPRSDAGDGQAFQSITRYQPGMARRAIDWKASARHLSLMAREYHPERDHSVVFAVDCGRAMADPIDGVPRLDRAVTAALSGAFVALKSGDRVRLFAFDARPGVDSGNVQGPAAFARLHDHAAAIDYGAAETNYTLSLMTLEQRLDRRSLIVLFTDFPDATSAELLQRAAGRLLRRHRVLFVLFHDVELSEAAERRPADADDITRANIADALLRERRIVIERLRRNGMDVIEAAADAAPMAVVERYLSMRTNA